jgi:hypothetical protein
MAFTTRTLYPQASSKRGHQEPRLYRLVDQEGSPHPVLDDLYESLEAAWGEAMDWWQEQVGPQAGPVNIGVEVSTSSGTWRTLRHPGC